MLWHLPCPALLYRRSGTTPIRTHAKLNSPAARVLERGPPPTIGFGHQLGERHIASRQRRTRLSAAGAIPTPCRPACRTARWAGTAAGVRMLPATASSAGPAPISRVATASSISASRSSALTLNSSGGPKGAACFVLACGSRRNQHPDRAVGALLGVRTTPISGSRSRTVTSASSGRRAFVVTISMEAAGYLWLA